MTSVTVANAYGSATTTAAFTPVPGAITAVSPGTAPVGTHITISGDFDLSPYSQLTFHGGVTVPASPAGSGNVTAVVPAGALTGAVTLPSPDGHLPVLVSAQSVTVPPP